MPIRKLFLCAGLVGLVCTANAASPNHAVVEETVATACALRGLTAKRPIVVRPMSDFAGGYTPGLGDMLWEESEAERWRAGWCAVGIYCAGRDPMAARGAKHRRLGLYDLEQDVVFVRNPGAPTSLGTVAHETVHALQHQNFPAALSVPHPWDNRDLHSAVNAATEGDAHLIGRWFKPSERGLLCHGSRTARTVALRRWQWGPQAYSAHEEFAHVFGPALALRQWLEAGVAGVNDLVRNPPLATRDVLKDGRPRPVDFIALPEDPMGPALTKRGCEVGLTNTVGALGIWALLALHDDASDETAPALIDQWLGDRFVHVACPGERDDELAWLTRWRSAEAAREFAARYRTMAASILTHGGVLPAAPVPLRFERVVVIITPGLQPALNDLLATEVQTFADFDSWMASGCFPHGECDFGAQPAPLAAGEFQGACAQEAGEEQRFDLWLRGVREGWRTRAAEDDLNSIWAAWAALPQLCPGKGVGQEDLTQACLAAHSGVRSWLGRQCAGDALATAVRAVPEPTAATDLWERFSDLHGARFAERRAAESGTAGVLALAASPPLSTLAIFRGQDTPVDFIALPSGRLAVLGCEVLSTHVQGVLGTWIYLTDSARIADATNPPAWLLDWRGDRFVHLRCGEHRGTAWATRWATEASALGFGAMVPFAPDSEVLAHGTAAGTHTVWSFSPEFAAHKEAIRQVAELRTYSTFLAWMKDGCFPQATCSNGSETGKPRRRSPWALGR